MNKGICFNYKYASNYDTRIKLLEEIGFNSVFIYSQYEPKNYIDLIKKSPLKISSLHLPYKKMENGKSVDSRFVNVLWAKYNESKQYVNELIKEVEFAHRYDINTVVMHITGGDTPPHMNEIGIANIEKVLNVCEKYNITLCLENLRRLDYLEYVFCNLDSKRLMFCFDSGHANSMTKNLTDFPWDILKNKLFYLHLNDNNGIKDQHLIPYDGNISWSELIKLLFSFNKDLELTLEVRSNVTMRLTYSEKQYLSRCYKSLERLQNSLTI
jgi:sugar phosphate isomerase/epimerase